MTIRTAEIIEDDNGHLLIKAMFSKDEWMTLDLNRCAEDDAFGIYADWVKWAKGELESQKGLRPDRCETCRVWCELEDRGHREIDRVGECRKKPPFGSQRVDSQVCAEIRFRVPVTAPFFWCGDWEPMMKGARND